MKIKKNYGTLIHDDYSQLICSRCCNVEPKAKLDELYMFPPAPFRTSYHLHGLPIRERHPLSQSTEDIFYNNDSYDPQPIVPNRTPDTPDVWIPRTIVRA